MEQGYPQQQKPVNGYQQQQNNMCMMMQDQPALSASTVNLVAESTEEQYTSLYVLSILATIFCTTLPCGIIGLMHIIAARADASRGSLNLAKKKRGQALCWTAWACGLGWGMVVIFIIAITVTMTAAVGVAKNSYDSYDSYSSWN